MIHNIAVVDDEEQILKSLEYVFMSEPYRLHTFNSPFKALQELTFQETAVVVSDLMMPRMDGVTFLKEVKKRCPQVECLIMTAYRNSPLIKEINIPVITKPWSIISFKARIAEAVVRYQLKMKAGNEYDT